MFPLNGELHVIDWYNTRHSFTFSGQYDIETINRVVNAL
jgi:hypothetical protein